MSENEEFSNKITILKTIPKKLERFGNPINKVIKFIEDEKLNTQNEKESLLNLIRYDDEYEKLAGTTKDQQDKKVFFTAKKVSTTEFYRKNSKKNCCSCKKSHCLKLYCECFKNGDYCSTCTCPNCLNTKDYDIFRNQSILFLKAKNKLAFKSVIKIDDKTEKHVKGCKCKNSSCQKNYCECFQNGLKCSISCKCIDCLNGTCEDLKEELVESSIPNPLSGN